MPVVGVPGVGVPVVGAGVGAEVVVAFAVVVGRGRAVVVGRGLVGWLGFVVRLDEPGERFVVPASAVPTKVGTTTSIAAAVPMIAAVRHRPSCRNIRNLLEKFNARSTRPPIEAGLLSVRPNALDATGRAPPLVNLSLGPELLVEVKMSGLIVRVDGTTYVAGPEGRLRFGRQFAGNDIVIGSERRDGVEDTLVSRLAGEISVDDATVVIRNLGRHHVIDVVVPDEPGRTRHVEPGDELRVRLDRLVLSVQGAVRRYELHVASEGAELPPALEPFDNAVAETAGPLELSDERLLDLAALAEPMIGGPRRVGARPASYADAAERRGISRKALEKRIEHLVADLRARGVVPGLEPGADVKQVVCDYVVRTGTVTAVEVARLGTTP
jgi:hypothetical protein